MQLLIPKNYFTLILLSVFCIEQLRGRPHQDALGKICVPTDKSVCWIHTFAIVLQFIVAKRIGCKEYKNWLLLSEDHAWWACILNSSYYLW